MSKIDHPPVGAVDHLHFATSARGSNAGPPEADHRGGSVARKKATWRQAELKITAGAEVWVIVRHRRGSFRLPVTATVEELLWGIADGWTMDRESHQGPKDRLRPDQRSLVRLWESGSEATS